MNNTLVRNSRFSNLKDENTIQQNYNNDRRSGFRSNNFDRPTLFKDRLQQKIDLDKKDKERKQQELEKSLQDINAFPELNNKPVINTDGSAYVDKLKWVKEEEPREELWYDSNIFELISTDENKSNVSRKTRKPATPAVIFKALTDNYEKWKAEYIEMYGYDEYENNYRFPNYDYEYFDKLDEKYIFELEEYEETQMEKEREDNYTSNYNEHEQYYD